MLLAALIGIAVTPARSEDPPAQTVTVTRIVRVPSTFAGKSAHHWHRLAYRRGRVIQGQHKMLFASPTVQEALALACVAYGVSCARVYWIAWCESTLQPGVENAEKWSDASGLGQFLSSTWRGTPYGRFSVFSAYANALAIAYEVARGGSYVHWAASAPCWSRRS